MNMDWLDIGKRVCVVTGAGGGIGRTIARALASAGAAVAVLDRDAETAERTAAEIRAAAGAATAIRCDIADPQSVAAAERAIEAAFGPVGILVNNAALLRNGPLAELSLEDWNAVVSVNLTGFFLCSQIFARTMARNGGGSIIHVASLSGTFPQPNSGAYSVSKAGVLMLSRNLALELGERGVRSNVVSPAMVLTPMSEVIYSDPVVRAKRESVVPLRRIGTPQDVADAVCFLASDRSGYVSGQEIVVDGGWSSAMLAMVPRPGFDREPPR